MNRGAALASRRYGSGKPMPAIGIGVEAGRLQKLRPL
jgi:hypothetical protein